MSQQCRRRHRHRASLLSREMKSSSSSKDRDERTIYTNTDSRARKTSLSVATLGDGADRTTSVSWIEMMRSLPEFRMGSGSNDDVGDAVTKVLSASLLVTSNTVGPSMFTLPEAVGGVGMMWGTVIFFGERAVLFSTLSFMN